MVITLTNPHGGINPEPSRCPPNRGREPRADEGGAIGTPRDLLPDWLDHEDLLSAGLLPHTADAVLARWGYTGHDGRACVERERLDERLRLLQLEGNRQ